MSLEHLNLRVQQDLDLLDYPRRPWLAPRQTSLQQPIHDVLIVGAGQSGLTTAFGLMRERVTNLVIVDRNPLDHAGPWLSFARMLTLRTPKYLTGPDLGVPSLTPRAYYEARFGPGSFQGLGFIPKNVWAGYLAWYRSTLGLPVVADTSVGALSWNAAERVFEVPCCSAANVTSTYYARRVVLATGIDGSGEWRVPRLVRDALPPELYAHTRDEIDFASLAGKRVVVLGAGASAFDNAATALEHGAREVHVLFRRHKLVNVNAYRWAEFAGFLHHYADLPDAEKWRFVLQILRMGQLPPADTLARAERLAGFHLHPGCAWERFEARGDRAVVHTARGSLDADFVIVATGFVTDLSARPELRHFEPHIARWSDRYQPPEADRHTDLENHPYLGPNFEFTERHPGAAPYLAYLYNYTFGGLLSLGFGGASISGLKYSAPRLVAGITRSLFLEDSPMHFQNLCAFSETEFQ